MIYRRRFALAALAALAACHAHKSKLDPPSAPAHTTLASAAAAAAAVKSEDGPPKHLPLTARDVAPIIHELGRAEHVPTSIVIELARPVVDNDAVGGTGEKTVLKITPEVPGRLAFTKPSELTFTPANGFATSTTYKVELKSLETPDGVLKAPAGKPWTYTFKTPGFRVLGWAPAQLDLASHTGMMRVAFSAPVLPNLARDAMTFTLNGQPLKVLAAPSGQSDVVGVIIGDKNLAAGAKLEVAMKAGVPSLTGIKAPATKLSYTVPSAAIMSIGNAELVEGSSGYYLEVQCSVGGTTTSYGYVEGARPCQLADGAADKIHFTPAVEHMYATPGRYGFRVFGDFKRGAYAIHIDAGLPGVGGAQLGAPFDDALAVSTRRPQLHFVGSGRYLPRNAWNDLGFKHLNVDAVNLVVRQIPPENLVFWMSADSDVADERTSNVILRKTIPLRGDPDTVTTSWLDVGSMIPTKKGVLELSLVGLGAKATSRLLLTNMSLVAKKWSDPAAPWHQTVRAWALDIDSAEPLSDVEISLVRKSGKIVARCTTSGADGCQLSADDPNDPDHAEPFALVAKKGDDLTYIRYADLRADVAESSTSGVPYVAESPYRASMFSDRGVYRPGETAHVVAIVRDAHDRAPDAGLPIEVRITDPRAKLVKKLTANTNAAGEIAIDHALPQFADTGHWQVSLSIADKPLASYDLQVEEFVPARMKVTAAPQHPDALLGEPLAFDVAARYLFGGSAMDSGVEMTCTMAPSTFAPKHNADLVYGVPATGKPVTLGDAKAQLDPSGKVTIACPAAGAATTFAQTGELTANISVLEAGSGRATVKTATMTVHPEKYYLGLRTKATQASPGEAFSVDGTVVDWNGDPLASGVDTVQIQLLHQDADYNYGYDVYSGEQRYDRWLREVPEGKQTAKVENGHFHFEVTPGAVDDGYVVRVTAGKARTDLVLPGEYYDDYYDYGYNDSRADMTPRPARATQLALDLPKDIEVGKPVTVKVKAPYRGKVLWTVETDHLITAQWRDATNGDLSWSFTLAAYAPNVYVSAFLIKDAHLESKQAFLPDRAYGVASTRVTPTAFTQEVHLTAPQQVRSDSPLTVSLDVGKPDSPTFAVVSVVDEGILQLTNFKTPDPLVDLFPKHELDVETYETIGWTMLHKPADPSARTGGGDDEAEAEGGALGTSRVQPVHPVALYSGILPVGADGKVTIPFHVPTYRGQLRVMAITSSATRIGRAEAEVTVRDPLVVEATFPRFLAQHDQLQIPVFLTNMSGGPLDVTVKLTDDNLPVAGLTPPKNQAAPLQLDKPTAQVHIDDGRSETVVFSARTLAAVGGAKLRVVADARGKAGTLEVKDEQDVPLLPAGPKDRVVQKIQIAQGQTSIDLGKLPALQGWVPTSETATFWLTTNPYAESFEHLDYLLTYPYGCIEQTTSSTFPLLYLGNLIDDVDPQLAELKIEDRVAAGIDRVLSMETPSGGFGYWPGATEPLEWATAYATHMLLEAKKAGYSVPDARLEGVLSWIEGRTAAYERGEHIKRDKWNVYDQQSEAYLQYVLALAGKGHKARMLALISKIPATATGADAEDRYLLEAGLYIAGDRRFERDLRHPDSSPIELKRVNDWSFYSDLRRRGMMLSTFHDLFGRDPAGEALAQRVAEGLANHMSSWYTTQELMWGIMGLGKWVGTPKGTTAAVGTVTADGATIAPHGTRGKDRTWSLIRAAEYKSLTLALPSSAAGLWLVVNSTGVRANGDYKTGGSGLALSRTYMNLDGDTVDPAAGNVKLGDLLYVELELENTSGEAIQNIALVDRLPAGFEIENARLGRGTRPDWVKDEEQWDVDFMNMRDDRVEAFGTLGAGETKKLTYTILAVTSGTFAVPPSEAGAMYDPTLWARTRGGTAVIGGPWTAKTL